MPRRDSLTPEQFRRSLCDRAPPARPRVRLDGLSRDAGTSCASLSRVCFDAEQIFLFGPDAAADLRAAARVLSQAPNLYDVKASGGLQESHKMVQLAAPGQPYEFVPLAVAAKTARRATSAATNRSRYLARGVQPAAPAPSEFANRSSALAFVTTCAPLPAPTRPLAACHA
jgi:hypothetical protein